MFVRKSTYKNLERQAGLLYAEVQSLRQARETLAVEKNKLRQALHAIVKQRTDKANATVSRMARYAEAALNGTFGNRNLKG